MKILITNTVVLNTGDSAILMGVLKILRLAFQEEIEFIIYDKNHEIAQKYYPDLKFRQSLYFNLSKKLPIKFLGKFINSLSLNRFYFAVWCWKHNLFFISKTILKPAEIKDVLEYSTADLIVSTGGTYLVENYSLIPRIFDYKISLLLEKPLIFFTQSLGPFSTVSNRKKFKYIFEESLLILLRDLRSKNNILDLHPQKVNAHVTADAAFVLAQKSAIKAAQNIQEDFSSPLKVAISVRDWQYFKTVNPDLGREKYLTSIAKATEYLVNKYEAKVTFISTCQGIPEYWTDDSKVALEVTKKISTTITDSVTVDRDFHSPAQLSEILKSFDFVISTRLHMAILSLGVGTPVLPIAYEFKTKELFKNLGQENIVLDIENINEELIISSIDCLITSINKIRSQLFSAVYKEYEKARNSHILVKEAFEKLPTIENSNK